MSALTLTLKQPLPLSIDVSTLTPDTLADKSVAEIAALPLLLGKKVSSVGELFNLEGNDCSHIIFSGDCASLDGIGSDMLNGDITVSGNAGYRCGVRLRGGTLKVSGNVGCYSGAGMRGGRLDITGNADDFLGAALPGEKQGMNGGHIVVHGNAADRVGDRLRRGVIIVHGNTGDYCASRMIAGSIVVAGIAGANTGYAMKRGTLLFNQAPKSLAPGLASNGTITLPFLNLLLKEMAAISPAVTAQSSDCTIKRYLGDRSAGGVGEVLILNA